MNKIAISSNSSWYVYNFRKNTILALIKDGHHVLVVAPIDEYSKKLESLGCQFISINIDKGGTNPIKDFKTSLSFFKIYRAHKPDIVLNFTPKNNIYGTLAASINRINCINNIAGLGTLFANNSILKMPVKLLYKLSQSKAKKVFFQNEDDRELFISQNLVPANITERLPGSGVDLTRFKVAPTPKHSSIRFLLVARMLYDKGIQEYVDAARAIRQRYPHCEFYLLGSITTDNPSSISQAQINSWVAEDLIHYLGSTDFVEKEMKKANCIVLPSYREGLPKSLLEAGAMGKPVIATDTVGCKDVVEDGVTGLLCKTRSPKDLEEKLEAMILMSHQQRLQMGKKNREKIELEFDEVIVINKYLHTIKQLLHSSIIQ